MMLTEKRIDNLLLNLIADGILEPICFHASSKLPKFTSLSHAYTWAIDNCVITVDPETLVSLFQDRNIWRSR